MSNLLPPKGIESIPDEILTKVLQAGLQHKVATLKWNLGDCGTYSQDVHHLLACSLVCKEWFPIVHRLLYTGQINIHDPKSASLLIRTVSEDLEKSCPIRHLHFSCMGREKRAELRRCAAELIVLCPMLQILDAQLSTLSFEDPSILLGKRFDTLHSIHMNRVAFNNIAHLLAITPNLKCLSIQGMDPTEAQYLGELSGEIPTEPKNAIPDGLHPPLFHLEELSFVSCEGVSASQWQWLLSSTNEAASGCSLTLQQMYEGTHGVATAIGSSVRNLYIRGDDEDPQRGDPELVKYLTHFTNLQTLRVNGYKWHWETLYDNIRSPLVSFAISFAKVSVDKLAEQLKKTDWLQSLEDVTVYHYADTDHYYDVSPQLLEDAKSKLYEACEVRKIALTWNQLGESSYRSGESGYVGGPTEGDVESDEEEMY